MTLIDRNMFCTAAGMGFRVGIRGTATRLARQWRAQGLDVHHATQLLVVEIERAYARLRDKEGAEPEPEALAMMEADA